MTAYEFTRFDADITHTLKAKGYDVDVVAMQIDRSNPGKECFRNTSEYKDANDTFIELTMSCEKSEAIWWMGRWMLNAMAYGRQMKDLNWMAFFMAAYDIRKSLVA